MRLPARAILCSLVVWLGACSTRPSIDFQGLEAGPTPADLTVDLTILSGDPDEGHDLVHRRTGRYLLYPNGDLHAAHAADLTPATRPGWVRSLDKPLLDAVWEQLVRPLIAAHGEADHIGNVRMIQQRPGQVTQLIEIRAGERLYQFGRTRAIDEPDDPLIDRLARAMASLAWSSDEPDQDILRIPRRYDFGPDPYARYRTSDTNAPPGAP